MFKIHYSMIQQFGKDLRRDIQGEGQLMEVDEEKHGARMNKLFYREFARELTLVR